MADKNVTVTCNVSASADTHIQLQLKDSGGNVLTTGKPPVLYHLLMARDEDNRRSLMCEATLRFDAQPILLKANSVVLTVYCESGLAMPSVYLE